MERFRKLSYGFLDTDTGLIWCDGTHNVKYNWKDAVELCQGLTMGGYEDWRLPTIKELLTLVDYSLYDPCTKLPNINSDTYWSSTTFIDNSGYAWLISFYFGLAYGDYKSFTYFVRVVRGGMK